MNTVCLCGSTRFMEDFKNATIELSRLGLTVITISEALPRNPDGSDGSAEDNDLKVMLDLVHLNKILRSDCILVVGDGYTGFSTKREIAWARMQGRPVLSQANYTSDGKTEWAKLKNYILAFG